MDTKLFGGNTTIEMIAPGAIVPSKTNPRTTFDTVALNELADSIRATGIQVPLLVKYNSGPGHATYEIVAGERRWRAAQVVELAELPCIVVDGMTDDQMRDMQLVENLQRADLHPVEEAECYRALVQRDALAPEEIAKKTGKSLSHVVKTIQLLELIDEAKIVYSKGHMTLDHALLLARLTPAEQTRAMLWLVSGDANNKQPLTEVVRQRLEDMAEGYWMRDCRLIDATPIRLKQWIADNVLLQLKTAPWDLGDAGLVPEAGSCTNCPKRTGANAALFGDLTAVEDTCTDPACFANKRVEFVQFVQNKAKVEGKPLLKLTSKTGYKPLGELDSIDLAKKKLTDGQWMQVKKGECADTRLGLMLDGDDMGKTLYVCANQKCKVHKHHVEGERAASVKSDIPAVENWKQRQDRERREYEEKARTENPARLAIYLAVREKATCGDEAALQVFLRSAVTEIIEGDVMGGVSRETVLRLGGDVKVKDDFQAQRTAVAKAIKAAQGVRLYAMLFDCIFGNLTEVNEYSDDEYKKQLFALAKAYGVDAAGIEKRTRVAQNVHPTAAQEAAALDKIDKAIKGLPGKKAKKRLSPEARKSIAANLRKKWAENKKGKV